MRITTWVFLTGDSIVRKVASPISHNLLLQCIEDECIFVLDNLRYIAGTVVKKSDGEFWCSLRTVVSRESYLHPSFDIDFNLWDEDAALAA